jgi:hypothetical protein
MTSRNSTPGSAPDNGLIPLSGYDPEYEISFAVYRTAFGRSFEPQKLIEVKLKDRSTGGVKKRTLVLKPTDTFLDLAAALRAGDYDTTISALHGLLS